MYKNLLRKIFGNMPKIVIIVISLIWLALLVGALIDVGHLTDIMHYADLVGGGTLMKSNFETKAEGLMKEIVLYGVLLWITIDGYKLVRYESSPNPDTHVKCPDCKELVVKNATACPHCQCKLIASE